MQLLECDEYYMVRIVGSSEVRIYYLDNYGNFKVNRIFKEMEDTRK